MPKPIINIDDIELKELYEVTGDTAERFGGRWGMFSTSLGAKKLGYNITVVPPGKRAFPFHNHRVNEEMFFILAGEGEIRIGEERYPVRSGDIIACPPGGPESAHQIINTGGEEMKYLAVSTRLSPEVAEYPDSGKFAVGAQYEPKADGTPQTFRFVGRESIGLDYWDGE